MTRLTQGRPDRAGHRWQTEHDFVVTIRYGTAINGPNLKQMVLAASEEAGIERTIPYELRHTAITFQIDAGDITWKIADWAGTSVRMIEEIYRHRLANVSEIQSVNVPNLNDLKP